MLMQVTDQGSVSQLRQSKSQVRKSGLPPLFGTLTALLITFFILPIGLSSARAQSALMSVPSTDVVAAKKVYLEMDYITNYASQREDAYHNFLPRAVAGVG